MLRLAVIWIATFLCNQSATVFWKEFARAERGMSNERIGASVAIAAVVALPLVVLAGRLIDRIGRRRGAAVIYTATAVGVLGAYSQLPPRLLLIPLILIITGTTAAVTLLNAWTAESFPTDLRGDSFGWANSLLGRLGFVISPLLVAELVAPFGWGRALSLTAAFPILALVLIWLCLPETAGKELEDSSKLAR
jgi:putative MFS transporter